MSQLYPMPSLNDEIDTEEEATGEFINHILNSIENGAVLKDIYGISDNVMAAIYAHAYDFYQKGRIDDALVFFQFLSTHDMYNADYILGLAAVYQRKKDYFKAVHLYCLCFAINNNINAMLYAGQCYLHLKDKPQAAVCFMTVCESGGPEPIKKLAQGYLAAIHSTKH